MSSDFGNAVSPDFGDAVSPDFGDAVSSDFGDAVSSDFGDAVSSDFGNAVSSVLGGGEVSSAFRGGVPLIFPSKTRLPPFPEKGSKKLLFIYIIDIMNVLFIAHSSVKKDEYTGVKCNTYTRGIRAV
jgi:hypothetical protein